MPTAAEIASQLASDLQERPAPQGRQLIALAGPPASGKSTVAALLTQALQDNGTPAALVSMDGFHLDNPILDARGLRDRKGAPETFDLGGFAAMLERLKSGGEVIAPRFDRHLDAAIGSSVVMAPAVRTIIVEGNYLLLDAPGWRDLRAFWNLSIFLSVPEAELEARLVQRWREHGRADDDARAWIEGNDLPNIRTVLRDSGPADIRIEVG